MEKNLGMIKEIHLSLFNLPHQSEPHQPKIQPRVNHTVSQPSLSSFEAESKLIGVNLPNEIEFENDV